MLYLDWFSTSNDLPPDSIDNPIRFPLSFALQSHPIPFEQRPRFCGFVVSNPTCSFRNETFHAIHAYRSVDSAGAYYNNQGGILPLKYPGGGSGDLSKYTFLSQRQFSISMENQQLS